MSVVTDEIRITEDVSGVDRASRAVEALGSKITTVGVAGAKVSSAMTFDTLQAGVSKATGELRQLEAAFRGLNKSDVVDVDVGRALAAKIAAKRDQVSAMRAEAGKVAASDGFDVGAARAQVQAAHDLAAANAKVAAAKKALADEEKSNAAEDALKRERLEALKVEQAYEKQLATIKAIEKEQRAAAGAKPTGVAANDNAKPGGMFAGMADMAGAANIASMIAGAALKIASAVASLAARSAELAITSTSFRENTQKSFEFLLKDATAARDLYEKALDVADEVGLEKENVVASLKHLLTAGFGKDEAIAAIEAAGNLAQVRDQAAADQLLEIFAAAKARGSFDERAMKSVANLGIARADVIAELAKATGKTIQVIEQELKAKEIGAVEGMSAIENAINNRFGGAGDKAGQTFSRIFGDLKGNFERLFDDVDLGPVKAFLGNIVDAFKGDAGKELKKAITDLFGAFAHLLDPLGGEGGKSKIASFISSIASAVQWVANAITDATTIANNQLDSMSGILEGKFSAAGVVLGVVVSAIKNIAAAVQWVAGAVQYALEAMNDAIEGKFSVLGGVLAGVFSPIIFAIEVVKGALSALGSVIDWIVGKWNELTASVSNAASALMSVGAAGAGVPMIAPPSTVVNGAAAAASSDVVGSARGASTTNNVTVHAAPPVVHVPADATPEKARQLGAAAAQAAHAENERLLIGTFRRLGMTG